MTARAGSRAPPRERACGRRSRDGPGPPRGGRRCGSTGTASRASRGWSSSSVVVSAIRRRSRSGSSAPRATSAGTATGRSGTSRWPRSATGCSPIPPERARLVVATSCFPTGVLGAWARRLAEAGLVAVVTATSPRRLPHPNGGTPLTGTNPIAIAVPSSDGQPVADVSMGAVTHGDVLSGRVRPEELVPFGGPHAHKAFALAAGVELLVGALAGSEPGAVVLAARPGFDPVPGFRELAGGRRLPGDPAPTLQRPPTAGRRAPSRGRPRRTRGPRACPRSSRCTPACRSGRDRRG